ncbi:hypothetical protein BUALT_Bualt02G0249800 [Buddleja alternifolia]|uniref:Paladin n=1 Tax=Buddleja alternifolia TaxID=168488 RepID=A0AAV6Y5C1_9LAMI|nr:hypothetical protein BUALT_Bualt02G0249800 [Buddleja alternifolia]
MKQRDGSVLGKKTILKSDHFPGCHNKRLANSLPVHGVAIPTTDGIRNVLKHIGAHTKGEQIRVLWINLREEPGINSVRVEQMEDRLKEDVLIEAARYGNKILVTDELPDGQMVDQWEPVSHDSVKTPLEVYKELTHHYLVDYERVPVTDEKSPKEQDFDILVHKISLANLRTEIVFNCQMGRGRTTTGMVIATLIYINRIGASVCTLVQLKYLLDMLDMLLNIYPTASGTKFTACNVDRTSVRQSLASDQYYRAVGDLIVNIVPTA